MSQYLLIHGAWHGAWCWERVAAGLRAAGHDVSAIDLPGMGADSTPLAEVSLQAWTDRVVRELRALPGPAILVGHSMGGMVITAAADAAPDRVSTAIYLCAFLPQDGESLYALATRPEGATTTLQQEATADGLCVTVPAASARATFYGHCAPAATEAALERLTPQPLRPILEPVSLRSACPVPRVYIECTDDQAIPIALQRFMASRSPGIRVYSLPTDHSPFLSLPDEVIRLLQNQL